MAGTPLTDAIEALTTYSNTVTGASDTTLSEAVATLASGYGGGVDWSAVAIGTEPEGAITLNFGNNKNFRTAAFRGCTKLTSVTVGTFPTAWDTPGDVFYGCTALASFDFGQIGRIGGSWFRDCSALTHVESTSVVRLNGTYIFQNSGIVRACFPNLTGLSGRAFESATHLELADIGSADTVQANLFNNAGALRTLIIRRSTMASLNSWSSSCLGGIYSNPTASTIYVPSSLKSTYQTGANWSSAYSAGVTFTALEGSPYESPTWYENA